MDNTELDTLLNDFLLRWPIENIKSMTLDEYVDIGNKDTFCQWVETKTRSLGSIKGWTSIKFGIYKRNDKDAAPKNYVNDNTHSWMKIYGNDKVQAFANVKQNILTCITNSLSGKFDLIDDIDLPDLFKWKVAFLYSNARLVPIYKREVLRSIGRHLGAPLNKSIKISDIQTLMIENKPIHMSVYEYMMHLYSHFAGKKEQQEFENEVKPRKRKASKNKGVKPQFRKGTENSIVEQKHNKIQEKLQEILIDQYGKECVLLEENFVDVKVLQPEYIVFYEVKSASYASLCIREALGQILFYSFQDIDPRPKKHIIVGQYPPNKLEDEYIQYLKDKISLSIDYMMVSLD